MSGSPARRLMDILFFATVFSVTFEKLHWEVAGSVSIADITAVVFLASYGLSRLGLHRQRVPLTVIAVVGFLALFLVVYLAGYFDLDTVDAARQFAKGLVKFVIHFLFLAAGVAYVARRGAAFYWHTLGWFCGGLVINSIYGILQLVAAQAGANLDNVFVAPVTGGSSAINLYGAVEGASIYRPNALTGDPNHLGIMLDIPLLVLAPLYLRLEPGHRWRIRLGALVAFMLVVELTTLSRSGILGLMVGGAILLPLYRRKLATKAVLIPAGAVVGVVAIAILTRLDFFLTVIGTRVGTGGNSTSAHFAVYDFIPRVIDLHPLFGLGLNTFSVYYELVTGKTNWGPHSFYVALIVETGVIGAALFLGFLWYVFRRLAATRRLGRALEHARDPLASRVRPLAWGLTAALAGTMAANFFYLTMSFYYFYVFLLLALAAPIVFGRRARSPAGQAPG